MGRMTSNVRDQLTWARIHLGDGTAPDRTRILSQELLRRARLLTVHRRRDRDTDSDSRATQPKEPTQHLTARSQHN